MFGNGKQIHACMPFSTKVGKRYALIELFECGIGHLCIQSLEGGGIHALGSDEPTAQVVVAVHLAPQLDPNAA